LRIVYLYLNVIYLITLKLSNISTFTPYLALADVILAPKRLKENAGGLFLASGMSKNRIKIW